MSTLGSTWRSIWRFHRLLAGILVLEYALAFAIVLTALGVLISRAEAISVTSGVNEQGLYVLQGEGVNRPVHRSEVFEAQARFEALTGEGQVAVGSSVPFLGTGSLSMPISVPNDPMHAAPLQVNAYEGGVRFASVLGLRLLHGRWFQLDEVVLRYGDNSHLAILSESLARRLFHGEIAVGKQVDITGQMHTVVGVVNPLAAPQYLGSQRTTYTLLLPKVPSGLNLLLIRYKGSVSDLETGLAGLRKHDAGKVNWSLVPYSAVRSRYFRSDRLTVAALAGVVLAVLVTALCGILGLTNYWVAKRRPQIAIRRALGATNHDIVVHFLVESGLLVAAGLVLGVLLKLSFGVYFGNLLMPGGAGTWLLSVALVLILALVVVYISLRRWLRMNPAALMRST
ncbi:ABC transporter permease [Dyella sp.]|uniref:ABC transporter permease n=1 Tax=Dyella sp. TaxID=1869338 RepID=UPI002D79A660|nr:FtsX-like permease family protein [Dyella sp.]HET7332319.1 FtsX-like permease family protein [Dyella sp.]